MKPGLTPEEDAELRRLGFLAQMSELSTRVQLRIRELRERDRRTYVRDPASTDVAVPRER